MLSLTAVILVSLSQLALGLCIGFGIARYVHRSRKGAPGEGWLSSSVASEFRRNTQRVLDQVAAASTKLDVLSGSIQKDRRLIPSSSFRGMARGVEQLKQQFTGLRAEIQRLRDRLEQELQLSQPMRIGQTDPTDSASHQPLQPSEKRSHKGTAAESGTQPVKRAAFHCEQKIAPLVGRGTKLYREEFEAVECWDLGSDGFSFLAHNKPHFERLMLILNRENVEMCIKACVTRCSLLPEIPDMLLVNCRFEERIDPPPIAPWVEARAVTEDLAPVA